MTIEAGDQAPGFTLSDHEGKPVALADFSGWHLLLYFYPRASTPGCTTQACDLRDRHDLFLDAGWKVVGISPDRVNKLAEFRAEYNLPFPLLSDEDHAVASVYGAWGIKKNYGREYEGLIRSTFVIGPSGVVEHAKRNVKASGHGERMVRHISTD